MYLRKNKQKTKKKIILCCCLEGHWRQEQDPVPDPVLLVRGPDPYQNATESEPWLRIRINLIGRDPDTLWKVDLDTFMQAFLIDLLFRVLTL
jgi:hypothetical protein